MKLLIFGQTGQVAQALSRLMPPDMEPVFLGRDAADLADPSACAGAIRAAAPDLVINAAAWTAVDKAETEEAAATLVNAASPGAMAAACAEADIPFLHISTDYVFDGSGDQPFRPGDPTGPLGAYGRSKLRGEEAVRLAGGRHLILRTSWVFSSTGANFVKTMLRLGREREVLRVVGDQTGGPTPAAAIAKALLHIGRAMQAGAPGGTYHFSGAEDVSWADFAKAIMEEAGLGARVEAISTADYPTPARRPANSRLDCSALERDFGLSRPDWRAGLRDVMRDLS